MLHVFGGLKGLVNFSQQVSFMFHHTIIIIIHQLLNTDVKST